MEAKAIDNFQNLETDFRQVIDLAAEWGSESGVCRLDPALGRSRVQAEVEARVRMIFPETVSIGALQGRVDQLVEDRGEPMRSPAADKDLSSRWILKCAVGTVLALVAARTILGFQGWEMDTLILVSGVLLSLMRGSLDSAAHAFRRMRLSRALQSARQELSEARTAEERRTAWLDHAMSCGLSTFEYYRSKAQAVSSFREVA